MAIYLSERTDVHLDEQIDWWHCRGVEYV